MDSGASFRNNCNLVISYETDYLNEVSSYSSEAFSG